MGWVHKRRRARSRSRVTVTQTPLSDLHVLHPDPHPEAQATATTQLAPTSPLHSVPPSPLLSYPLPSPLFSTRTLHTLEQDGPVEVTTPPEFSTHLIFSPHPQGGPAEVTTVTQTLLSDLHVLQLRPEGDGESDWYRVALRVRRGGPRAGLRISFFKTRLWSLAFHGHCRNHHGPL